MSNTITIKGRHKHIGQVNAGEKYTIHFKNLGFNKEIVSVRMSCNCVTAEVFGEPRNEIITVTYKPKLPKPENLENYYIDNLAGNILFKDGTKGKIAFGARVFKEQ